MQSNYEENQTEKDINFLKEIRERITDGFNRKDPTQVEYGLKMIDDWINELTELRESQE